MGNNNTQKERMRTQISTIHEMPGGFSAVGDYPGYITHNYYKKFFTKIDMERFIGPHAYIHLAEIYSFLADREHADKLIYDAYINSEDGIAGNYIIVAVRESGKVELVRDCGIIEETYNNPECDIDKFMYVKKEHVRVLLEALKENRTKHILRIDNSIYPKLEDDFILYYSELNTYTLIDIDTQYHINGRRINGRLISNATQDTNINVSLGSTPHTHKYVAKTEYINMPKDFDVLTDAVDYYKQYLDDDGMNKFLGSQITWGLPYDMYNHIMRIRANKIASLDGSKGVDISIVDDNLMPQDTNVAVAEIKHDKLDSDYEIFMDESYYGKWCVRNVNDRRFNSPTSFHFTKKEDAEEFKRLLDIAD